MFKRDACDAVSATAPRLHQSLSIRYRTSSRLPGNDDGTASTNALNTYLTYTISLSILTPIYPCSIVTACRLRDAPDCSLCCVIHCCLRWCCVPELPPHADPAPVSSTLSRLHPQ
jgi:hypothetical protein